MTTSRDNVDPLAPVKRALLERARRDADAILAEADAAAAMTLAAARAEADAILAEARAMGEADATAVLAAEDARAEREARGLLLSARRVAEEQDRQAARDAVSALLEQTTFPEIRSHLRDCAERELGQQVVVSEQSRGGIVAEVPGRRVEYLPDDLADDLLDRLAARNVRAKLP